MTTQRINKLLGLLIQTTENDYLANKCEIHYKGGVRYHPMFMSEFTKREILVNTIRMLDDAVYSTINKEMSALLSKLSYIRE